MFVRAADLQFDVGQEMHFIRAHAKRITEQNDTRTKKPHLKSCFNSGIL